MTHKEAMWTIVIVWTVVTSAMAGMWWLASVLGPYGWLAFLLPVFVGINVWFYTKLRSPE